MTNIEIFCTKRALFLRLRFQIQGCDATLIALEIFTSAYGARLLL